MPLVRDKSSGARPKADKTKSDEGPMAVQVGRTNAQSQGGSRHYRTEQAAVAVAGSGTTGTSPSPANEAYTIPQQKAIAPQPKHADNAYFAMGEGRRRSNAMTESHNYAAFRS